MAALVEPAAATMDEIERANIECRRDSRPAPELDQALGEQHSRIPMIEAAVNVRGLDRNQPVGPEHSAGFGDDAHGHGRRLALTARCNCLLIAVEFHATSRLFRPRR